MAGRNKKTSAALVQMLPNLLLAVERGFEYWVYVAVDHGATSRGRQRHHILTRSSLFGVGDRE